MNLNTVIASALIMSCAAALQARTWVIPHVLETSGRVQSDTYALDTELVATFISQNTSKTNNVTLEVYFYDQVTGAPMRGAAGPVCNPCTYVLDSTHPYLRLTFDEIIRDSGGGFDQEVKTGFAVVVAKGEDPNAVNLQGFVVNSHTSPFDVSVFPFTPQETRQSIAQSRSYSFPHFVQSLGSDPTYRFDNQIFALYSGGKGGVPDGGGAEVALYLYDAETGAPFQNKEGNPVCAPCTINLNSRRPTANINLGALLPQDGSSFKSGFGVMQISGADPNSVHLLGTTVNTHSNPFDVSISDLSLQPVGAKPGGMPPETRRTWVIPHVLERAGLTDRQTNTLDSGLFLNYVGGLADLPANDTNVALDLFLFDQATGKPLRGATGEVCNPCSFTLDKSNRKLNLNFDNLITSNGGGFDEQVKTAFAILLASGDVENTCAQGFVVNSHTSSFDLSVFGFEPQVLSSEARRSFVLPHILESSGRTGIGPFSFDTTVFATYTSGLAGSSGGATPSGTVHFRLMDRDTGAPFEGSNGPVCDPCTFELSPEKPTVAISLQSILEAASVFETNKIPQVFAQIDLSGDSTNITLQAFVVNSHTSAFDLSVFGFEPQPLLSAPEYSKPPTILPPQVADGSITISFPTNPGENYILETAPDLSGKWDGAVESIPGTGNAHTLTEPLQPEQKFFRVRVMNSTEAP